MLTLVDMLHLSDAPAHNLSGGEKKRLALARVLISDPEILLLDEPVAHLDRRSRRIVGQVLRETRATLILTTHDSHFAHLIADRVLNLKAGCLTPGLPDNVLTGRREGELLITDAGLRIHLPPGTPIENGSGLTSVVIDPRSLVLSCQALTSSMRNCFRGRVCSIRNQNQNVWLEIDCGEQLTTIISQEAYRELALNLDQEVLVSFKANAVEVL
jgi:molybdopterin-binding protein